MRSYRVLIVDLNNFARYPTIAVGYLASVLRRADHDVTVLSPLAVGVSGVEREPVETPLRAAARRVNYALSGGSSPVASAVRDAVALGREAWGQRDHHRVVDAFRAADVASYDLVLVSAYLMYHGVCEHIGTHCRELGVPLIVGGSYFADQEVVRAWLDLPGLTALVGGEVELELPALVAAAVQGQDLSHFAGVWLPSGEGSIRPPLQDLDAVPFPDYRDFPWHLYPNRIVPMITGRGCGWGVCAFCSDVTSTTGRTHRSRSPENVLEEVALQARRHETSLFVFTDLKLNSQPEVWEALITGVRTQAPGARWVAAVHVGAKGDQGLDRPTLVAASRGGLKRLTTGIESGSQRVLDAMKKGTDVATTSAFLHDAASAGISVRATMIHGYPGERAEDVIETAEFLERHETVIDRVLMNRFQIMLGPAFLRRFDADPSRFPGVRSVRRKPRLAIANHEYEPAQSLEYARATQRMLSAVNRINRKSLPGGAADFEGVM